MIRLLRPAPVPALAEMFAWTPPVVMNAKGRALRGAHAIAARHAALSRSWGAWAEDLCVACGGLYAHGDGRLEAWFACRPEAARHMPALVGQARLTLSAIAETERVEILARVAAGWRPGQRLAWALGFRLGSVDGGVEIWRRGQANAELR